MFKGVKKILSVSAIALLCCGIAFAVLMWLRSNNYTVIEFSSTSLTVNGQIVSKVIKNPKDGYPDFPDSSYTRSGYDILPLKRIMESASVDPTKAIIVTIPDSFLYVTWKPILITLANSGYDSAIIHCSNIHRRVIYFDNDSHIVANSKNKRFTSYLNDACIFIGPDSIIARRTCAWFPPAKTSDSVLGKSFAENEVRERIYSIPSNYTERDFVNLLNALKPKTKRLSIELNPSITCKDFARFDSAFDEGLISRKPWAASRYYNDHFLKFWTLPQHDMGNMLTDKNLYRPIFDTANL